MSSYGSSQREDHQQYDALSDPTHPLTKDTIPMADRSDPWDSRPSTGSSQSPPNGSDPTQYQHLRQISTASASDILNQPYQHPGDSLSNDYAYKSSYHSPPQEKPENVYPASRPALPTSYPSDDYYTSSRQNRSAHTDGLI